VIARSPIARLLFTVHSVSLSFSFSQNRNPNPQFPPSPIVCAHRQRFRLRFQILYLSDTVKDQRSVSFLALLKTLARASSLCLFLSEMRFFSWFESWRRWRRSRSRRGWARARRRRGGSAVRHQEHRLQQARGDQQRWGDLESGLQGAARCSFQQAADEVTRARFLIGF